MRRILLSIYCLALVGCSFIRGPQLTSQKLALLPPETFGAAVMLVQEVEVQHPKGSNTFQAHVEVTRSRFTLVGLSPLGTRLLTVNLKDGKCESQSSIAELPVDLCDLLPYVQYALWPKIPSIAGLEVIERSQNSHERHRQVFYHGEKLCEISYRFISPEKSSLVLTLSDKPITVKVQNLHEFDL